MFLYPIDIEKLYINIIYFVMAISVYCVTPLAISIAYVLIYAAALIALLVKNKARFTN